MNEVSLLVRFLVPPGHGLQSVLYKSGHPD